jgi:hypothetical protein
MRLDLFLKQARGLACVALVLSSCKKQEGTTSRAVESGKASTKQEAKAEPKALVELADFTKEQALPEASPTKVAEPASENVDLPLSEEAQAMLKVAAEVDAQMEQMVKDGVDFAAPNIPAELADPSKLIATIPFPEGLHVDGLPVKALASVGDQSVVLNSNENGSFCLAYVPYKSEVKVVLNYPLEMKGKPLHFSSMDGGKFSSELPKTIKDDGTVSFSFQFDIENGHQRIIISTEGDEKTLRFWQGPKPWELREADRQEMAQRMKQWEDAQAKLAKNAGEVKSQLEEIKDPEKLKEQAKQVIEAQKPILPQNY